MPTAQLLIAALTQLAILAAIVVLALAGVISGPTAVALIAPHLAIRAFLALRPPPPPPGSSSGSSSANGATVGAEQGSGGGLGRTALLAVLRVFDPLAELAAVAAGGVAVLELVGAGFDAGAAGLRYVGALIASASIVLVLAIVPGCAALESFFGAAAPVAGQVAAGALAAAVAEARAKGQLPADPDIERIVARLSALEAAERAEKECSCSSSSTPDAGVAPPLDARAVVELLDREAAARIAAAAEREALARELRAALERAHQPTLPMAPAVLPPAPASTAVPSPATLDAGVNADGAP